VRVFESNKNMVWASGQTTQVTSIEHIWWCIVCSGWRLQPRKRQG